MKALLFVCVCAVALTAAVVYAQGTHRTVTLFVQDPTYICLLCIYLQVAPLSIARYVLYSFRSNTLHCVLCCLWVGAVNRHRYPYKAVAGNPYRCIVLLVIAPHGLCVCVCAQHRPVPRIDYRVNHNNACNKWKPAW